MKVGKASEQGAMVYLHLSDNTPVTEEQIELADGKKVGVLWKDVLVEGEYPMSPGPGGAVAEKMTVIADGQSDGAKKIIAMSDVIAAHEDAAFKYVTIPTSHKDGPLENTGYVPRPKGVRVIEKDGKKVMQSALGFTEPDVKGKVERGSVPDVSGGFFFNWLNKATKKRYPCAMKHVALTNIPFMGNLDGFAPVFASDDEIDDSTTVEHYYFSDEKDPHSVDLDDNANTGEIVWNEANGANWVREKLEEALRPESTPQDGRPYVEQPSYYVRDVDLDNDRGLVTEYFKGDSTRFVIPFTRDTDDVVPAPQTRWVEAKEAMIAASDSTDDFEERTTASLREKLSLALSDLLGRTDAVYRVDDVSLDQRARIVCNAKGKSWVANFAWFSDGSVWLEPSDRWKETAVPSSSSISPATVKQPAVPKMTITLNDDVSERRAAAIEQRRLLLQGH